MWSLWDFKQSKWLFAIIVIFVIARTLNWEKLKKIERKSDKENGWIVNLDSLWFVVSIII